MRNLKFILFQFILLISIISCNNYTSVYPLSKTGESNLPDEILGNWLFYEEDSITVKLLAEIEILEWQNYEYLVLLNYFKKSSLKFTTAADPFKIWQSNIDSTEIININFLREPLKYKFLKYSFNKAENSIDVQYLSDSLIYEAKSSEELRNYFSDNFKLVSKYWSEDSFKLKRWESILWNQVNKSYDFEFEEFIVPNDTIYEHIKTPSNFGVNKFKESKIELIQQWEKVKISTSNENLIDIFNNYHLSKANPSKWFIKPKFYIFTKPSGNKYKIIINERWLWDESNEYTFKRK